jgi:hypothetical protein
MKKVLFSCCVLLIELALLTKTAFFSGGEQKEAITFVQDDFLVSESGTVREAGFYAESTQEHPQSAIVTDEFVLDKGVYNVKISYRTENTKGDGHIGAWSEVVSKNAPIGYVESGKARLIKNLAELNYHVYVKADNTAVYVSNGLEDNYSVWLVVDEVSVTYLRKQSILHDCAVLLFFFIIIDVLLICFLFLKNETKNFIRNNAAVLLIMSTAVLIADFPLFKDGLGDGFDIGFHMHRIYEIANSLKQGVFPVYIMPDWVNDYGYAAGIFYGDTFMYIPALIYICGFSLAAAYKFYVFYMNVLTALIAYFCFKKITDNKIYGAGLGAMYVLALFRLITMYQRASAGEWTAACFFPLVMLGFWEIYHETDLKRSWIYVVLGSMGLISTHILCSLFAFAFSLMLILMCIKKIRNTYKVLIKAFIGAVLANLYFVIPFLTSYLHNDLIEVDLGNIYQWPAYLGQIFSGSYQEYMAEVLNGMQMEMPISIGIAGLFIGIIAIYCYAVTDNKDFKRDMLPLLILYGLALVLSTDIFPYKWIYLNVESLRSVFRVIQFPYRFLSVATAIMAMIAAVLLKYSDEYKNTKVKQLLIFVIAISCLGGADYVAHYNSEQPLHERNVFDHDEGDSYDACSYGEYLLNDLGNVDNTLPVSSNNEEMTISNYEKKGIRASVIASNTSDVTQYVDFPLQCYFGYRAYGENGNLQLVKSEDAKVRIIVPSGYEGSITVKFAPPFYWGLSWVISGVFIIWLLGLLLFKYKINSSRD